MFEKYSNYFNNVINYDLIFANQKIIIEHYVGVPPSSSLRLRSIFREDDYAPGCRFSYYKGKWYFIDNATYKGKLSFDCIAIVMHLEQLSSYKEAARFIIDNIVLDEDQEIVNTSTFKPIIKFVGEKNYKGYFQTLELPVEYLTSTHCYRVKKYWCNNKNDSSLRLNPLGNPKEEEIYAYYFKETGNVKLYFPNREKNKFYTNCKNEDVFGYTQAFDYTKPLIVTKSGKDCMFLNYTYGYNTIALQSETISSLSSSFLLLTLPFNKIIVWLDNDYTGIKYSEILTTLLRNKYPNKEIINNIHPDYLEKDPTDMYFNNELDNYIKYDFSRKL